MIKNLYASKQTQEIPVISLNTDFAFRVLSLHCFSSSFFLFSFSSSVSSLFFLFTSHYSPLFPKERHVIQHFIFIFFIYFLYHSSCRKDQFTLLNLKFDTQDFTDPGLLKLRWTLTGLSLCFCLHKCSWYSGYPCITHAVVKWVVRKWNKLLFLHSII